LVDEYIKKFELFIKGSEKYTEQLSNEYDSIAVENVLKLIDSIPGVGECNSSET